MKKRYICLVVLIVLVCLFLLYLLVDKLSIKYNIGKHVKSNKESYGSKHIPKKIFQLIQDKNNIPPRIQININSIKKLNPNWTYTLYDDNDIIQYLKQHYPPNITEIYNKINPDYGAARADFFRYLLMYKEGGVYLDVKSGMKIPLDQIIKKDDEYILVNWNENANTMCNLTGTKYGEFQQWHIMCKPNHPFLETVIDNVSKNILNYDKNTHGVGKIGVLIITGPVAYTKAIDKILHNHKHTKYDRSDYIGLIYNNTSSTKSHKNLFKNHYSTLTTPVVNNNNILSTKVPLETFSSLCYMPRSSTFYMTITCVIIIIIGVVIYILLHNKYSNVKLELDSCRSSQRNE